MGNVELLEMRERFNYDLSKSMIDISKKILNEKAENYGMKLNSLNDELFNQITINLFTLLEENGSVINGTHESLYDNANDLRNTLQKELLDLVQISRSLSKIIDEKMGHQLLNQIKENGSNDSTGLDDYVGKTVKAGKTLSSSSFPNIESQINDYIKKIIADLNVGSTSIISSMLEERLSNYKNIYLYCLSIENKNMFGNFANLVSTAGTYFVNYATSVDELTASKNVNITLDELGVPMERKSLSENLENVRELYLADTKRTK